jgi:SMI1 / KNR4 family (SUKH-1)
MLDPKIERAIPFKREDLDQIERVLGRQLPKDYHDFAQEYGGAFVGGLIDGDLELPLLTFFDIGEVHSHLESLTDLRDIGVMPFAGCALGNIYVMETDNSIHYINYYGGRTTARKVSDTFNDFIARIVVIDE